MLEIEISKPDSQDDKGTPDKMEVESALHTLMEACEIQADPALMAAVKKLAGEKKQKISSIADLKGVYDEKYNKSMDEDMPPEEDMPKPKKK